MRRPFGLAVVLCAFVCAAIVSGCVPEAPPTTVPTETTVPPTTAPPVCCVDHVSKLTFSWITPTTYTRAGTSVTMTASIRIVAAGGYDSFPPGSPLSIGAANTVTGQVVTAGIAWNGRVSGTPQDGIYNGTIYSPEGNIPGISYIAPGTYTTVRVCFFGDFATACRPTVGEENITFTIPA